MYCPNCKQYNEGVYCPECGAKLIEAPECDEVVARESYCPNCKQHFEGIYCPECGAKLVEAPECDEASAVKMILKARHRIMTKYNITIIILNLKIIYNFGKLFHELTLITSVVITFD